MHTTLNRRAVRRRNGFRRVETRRRSHGGPSRLLVVALALPIVASGIVVALSAVAFLGAVSAYAYFSQGLADPTTLEHLTFSQPSTIYDRTGTIVLATFGVEQREPVTYDQIAPVVIDATTSVEDKDFWTNAGFDPFAIVSAAIDSLHGDTRGASTITQQLVRQRLLDPALVQDPNRQVERKIKEIIQSARLTQAFPGEKGKEQIITAYLNQNYYGSQLYGIKAAARGYFGVNDLSELTLAQAAILAAIPQSPTSYDLRHNAVTLDDGTLVVPSESEIVQRRNYVLELMKTRSVLTAGDYTAAQYDAAKNDPVTLVPEATPRWVAPQFVWQVRDESTTTLCGANTESCTALETGGYKIITTLDVKMQQTAEKWVKASTIVPHAKDPVAAAKALGLKWACSSYDACWMQRLRNENVWNGALVAMDYTTGEIYAYVGSADYYASKATPKMQPQFDVLSDGWRQPGSAFKPVHYSIGINDHTFTAATMFMDVTTDFGGGYAPTDADNLERGPVRLRGALQWSENIPAIKAMYMNGPEKVFADAQKFGIRWQGTRPTAGLSMGIGTEVVHPVDLANAYATIADGGLYVPHTGVLKITDPAGNDAYTYKPPTGTRAISAQAAYIITDILKGNTNPDVNPAWGRFQIVQNGARRPATLKTGTNDQARDLGAYGFIAPSKDDSKYPNLVVGVWNGNSDYTPVGKIFSFDAPTYVWQGFLTEVTKGWPVTDWKQPSGIVHAKVDAWSGMLPGPFTSKTVDEIFIKGTQPTKVDDTKVGSSCGGVLDLSHVDAAFPPSWQKADDGWIARAIRGIGIKGGPNKKTPTATAYFAKPYFMPYGATWGAPFASSCGPGASSGPGNGNGTGGGGAVPTPSPHQRKRYRRRYRRCRRPDAWQDDMPSA